MKLNSNTVLEAEGGVARLVPYREEHVVHYHAWMQSQELLDATASEPLTLEEEYAMQRSWAQDEDKCTFIVLDKELLDTPGTGTHGGGMAGDVNLFLNDPDDKHAAEIEVMIAEPKSRGKGLATEALQLLMSWAVVHLGIATYRAKIGEGNQASLALFAKLGYKEVSRSAVWKEVTLELAVQGKVRAHMEAHAAGIQSSWYDASTT